MAIGDIKVLKAGAFGEIGARPFQVASGTTESILPGEPVAKALSAQYVTAAATNTPVVGTDYYAGIATSTSTETASADGIVYVMPLVPGVIYIAPANSTPANQAAYDATIGNRVLFDLTTGDYTVLTTDNANNGLVIEPLDIALNPGKIAFSVRNAVSYTA